jgi:hypothetical protein
MIIKRTNKELLVDTMALDSPDRNSIGSQHSVKRSIRGTDTKLITRPRWSDVAIKITIKAQDTAFLQQPNRIPCTLSKHPNNLFLSKQSFISSTANVGTDDMWVIWIDNRIFDSRFEEIRWMSH